MTSLPWYHKTAIYQVYPRSFYDSNGDGVGDLQGLIQKLDYIQELGFETIWVSPFFSSPQADTGYDVSNYTDVAPEYGSMHDALQLIEAVHQRKMRVVLDLVMNHTSKEHPWFAESRSSRHNPKADWYIWRDRPTNWQSMTGGNGWHYAKERNQYYWATFLPFQPDLNYRNPEVKQTMLDIVRFWLGKGVDGFRLDIFNYIYEDADFRNNPFSFTVLPSEEASAAYFQQMKYTVNQPESFAFAREFRKVCEEFGEKLSVGEVSGGTEVIRRFLGDESNHGLTMVFDFGMLNFEFTAAYFHSLIRRMEDHYPYPYMPVYTFSNHDKHRSMSRLDGDVRKAKLLHTLQLTVRGVPCMYYGEEIGMLNGRFPLAGAQDPIAHKFRFIPRSLLDRLGLLVNRDEVRTPMQWDATRNAGFSSAVQTWLPVSENNREINVQKDRSLEGSLLQTVRTVLEIRRRELTLQEGSLELLHRLPSGVLGYARTLGTEKTLIVLNFEEHPQEFQWQASESVFKLSEQDEVKHKAIRLDGFGGMICKQNG